MYAYLTVPPSGEAQGLQKKPRFSSSPCCVHQKISTVGSSCHGVASRTRTAEASLSRITATWIPSEFFAIAHEGGYEGDRGKYHQTNPKSSGSVSRRQRKVDDTDSSSAEVVLIRCVRTYHEIRRPYGESAGRETLYFSEILCVSTGFLKIRQVLQ